MSLISCKFTRPVVERELPDADLALEAWHEDDGHRLACAVARLA